MTRATKDAPSPTPASPRRDLHHHPHPHYHSRHERPARSSVVPSVLPYLRRLDVTDDMSPPHKPPLLTLKLSSPSFLNTTVKDDLSRTPLYLISTDDSTTTITRSDPWDGPTKAAQIRWSQSSKSKGKGRDVDGVQLTIRDGRWKPVDEFLRTGSVLSSPSKFKIPGYSHTLKWKAVGTSYWCLAASAKGPIAVLEPSVDSMPARLKVFETLHDKYDVRPMLVHHGVSILLLDYLLVSALLLVKDVREGSSVDLHSVHTSPVPAQSQWKRLLHGETFFPKRASSLSSPSMLNLKNQTSAQQLAKIIHGDPIHPTLRTPSPDFSDSDNESESELETDPESEPEAVTGLRIRAPAVSSRAPSPSAESVFYPLTPASAPSHTYLDPSFYVPPVPPVPQIPAQYASSNSSRGQSPSLPSASSSGSRRIRELPPPPPKQGYSHRSRSSPPRPHTAPRPSTSPSSPDGSESSRASVVLERRPSCEIISRSNSMAARTLPLPPQSLSQRSRDTALRHTQSTTRLHSRSHDDRRASHYPARTLPPTPTSTTSHSSWWVQKSIGGFSEWLVSTGSSSHTRESSLYDVDSPPPAYSSIDFAAGHGHESIPPVPPLPHNI
ncbi:hypothetical protein K435DRAFT_869027 [Dendrothele bispora CBS 962.96]|uniref:Uncharacterized protein n=1 Tax=Dendrothele bispora (strain CBS 962.96) TaxID=1314807 RepID=A0A4S8LAX8_DENBC|nr:hypothetical protein K435DRAFT_869027 [Dendrothele bispora CBS 962.96]